MERGLDQLIFFAFIVLAALVDWVVRVIRNRNAPPRPPVEEPEYFEEEAEYPEVHVAEYPRQFVAPAASQPVASREVVFDAPLPAEWRQVMEARHPVEAPRLEPLVAAEFRPRLPDRPAATRPVPMPTAGAHHWRREALGLRQPDAARRAIVMMAVLGPCRGLEDERRW